MERISMSSTLKRWTEKGYTVRIELDDEPDSGNPREYHNLGVMLANGHRRYTLGDANHPSAEYDEAERALNHYIERHNAREAFVLLERYLHLHLGTSVMLPLYLLDHSGLAMRTGPFWEDPGSWDSGVVGVIFDTASTRETTGCSLDQVEASLRSEVDEYDRYLRGEVYGYIIENAHGDTIESCWGFLGQEHVEGEVTAVLALLDPDVSMSDGDALNTIVEALTQDDLDAIRAAVTATGRTARVDA